MRAPLNDHEEAEVLNEYLDSRLGFAAPSGAYVLETNWRRLVGNVAQSSAIDSILDVLEG